MERVEFIRNCNRAATVRGWSVDFVEVSNSIEAWFIDASGRDAAQSYMVDGQSPVGLLPDSPSSAHPSAISPAARETAPVADNSGGTLPSQQPGDDDLMDDLYQHGIDSYDAREAEHLQSCRDFDAEKIEQERESEETSPAFLPFDMGHNIDDPRYQHVKCVTCGKMWQSIDFGCAAHVTFCANPLLRYAP